MQTQNPNDGFGNTIIKLLQGLIDPLNNAVRKLKNEILLFLLALVVLTVVLFSLRSELAAQLQLFFVFFAILGVLTYMALRFVPAVRKGVTPLGKPHQLDPNESTGPCPPHQHAARSAGPIKSRFKLTEISSAPNPFSFETTERMITIGRAPDRDVVLNNPKVSWHHGYIEKSGDQYCYHHTGTNPTIIRRRHQEHLLTQRRHSGIVLQNNDRIIIGDVTLTVEFDLVASASGYVTTEEDKGRSKN